MTFHDVNQIRNAFVIVMESDFFAESSKASVDEISWLEAICFSEYLRQFVELYGKLYLVYISSVDSF